MALKAGLTAQGPVVVIVPMVEEVAALKAALQNAVTEMVGCREFLRGTINNKDVVLVICGIGRVNSAMTATLACERFKPRLVINTGSAGGLAADLKIGSVVFGETLVYGDVDNRSLGYKMGQVCGMPVSYGSHPGCMDIHAKVVQAQQGDEVVKRGIIASVESFVMEQEEKDRLKKEFPGILAVEMEAASIAQVCHSFNVPLVVVRSISDTADDHTVFERFVVQAGEQAGKAVIKLLAEL